MIGFLLGIPVLVLLGGIVSAVTISLRRHPATADLAACIPFYIPVLIFAVAACDAAAMGNSAAPHLDVARRAAGDVSAVSTFIIASALRNGQG